MLMVQYIRGMAAIDCVCTCILFTLWGPRFSGWIGPAGACRGGRKLLFADKVYIVTVFLRNLLDRSRISPLEDMLLPMLPLQRGYFSPFFEYFFFASNYPFSPRFIISYLIIYIASHMPMTLLHCWVLCIIRWCLRLSIWCYISILTCNNRLEKSFLFCYHI